MTEECVAGIERAIVRGDRWFGSKTMTYVSFNLLEPIDYGRASGEPQSRIRLGR